MSWIVFRLFKDSSHCARWGWKIRCQRGKQRKSYSYSKCGYYEGSKQWNCLNAVMDTDRYLLSARWRGGSAWKIEGRNSYYKFFWKGDDSGSGGVGVLVAGKWIDIVILVVRHSTRLIMPWLFCGKSTLFVCMFLNQVSLLKKEIVSINICLF